MSTRSVGAGVFAADQAIALSPADSGPRDDELSDAALAWIVRLNSGEANTRDVSDWQEWKQRSPAHALAAQEAESLWGWGDGLACDAQSGLARVQNGTAPQGRARLSRRAVLRSAAVLGLAGGLGGWGYLQLARPRSDLMTAAATRQDYTLQDGTRLSLDAMSGADLAFGPGGTLVTLNEGQAWLEPGQAAPSHPLALQLGKVMLQAGNDAAFEVTRNLPRAEKMISVAQGEVHLAHVDDPQAGHRLVAGDQLRLSSAGEILTGTRFQPANAALWREGLLLAENSPLEDIVAGLTPYHPGQILFRAQKARALRVNAMLNIEDPFEALRVLATGLPIRVDSPNRYLTLISSA